MMLLEKLDMWLLVEAPAKLTPLAKSMIRLQDIWTKETLDDLVDGVAKNAKDKKRYEITFSDRKTGQLAIYRRGDDVLKRNMSKEDIAAFRKEIKDVLKGTGMKIVGDAKSADWASVLINK